MIEPFNLLAINKMRYLNIIYRKFDLMIDDEIEFVRGKCWENLWTDLII